MSYRDPGSKILREAKRLEVANSSRSRDVMEAVPEWGISLNERVAALELAFEALRSIVERQLVLNKRDANRLDALEDLCEECCLVEKGLGP